MLFTAPNPPAWVWGYRSVVRLLKVTVGGYGPLRTTVPAQPFNSRFEMSVESPLPEFKAIVFAVDDDLSVRQGLERLLRAVGWKSRDFCFGSGVFGSPKRKYSKLPGAGCGVAWV
jgi:hypothetical protein